MTLFNIITAINKIENDSCTVQIVREPFNVTIYAEETHYFYESSKTSTLTKFAKKLIEEKSIPVVLVDLLYNTDDDIFSYGFQFSNTFTKARQSFYIW